MSQTPPENEIKSKDCTNIQRELPWDFTVPTETLKLFGKLGALRRAPAPPELQLDGVRSWIRYHQLEYRDQTLTLRPTDNRCVISCCQAVEADNAGTWIAVVNSEKFHRLMSVIDGAQYRVLREDASLLFRRRGQMLCRSGPMIRQYDRMLRLPLGRPVGDFPKPAAPSEEQRTRVSRSRLAQALSFLVGRQPSPTMPDPSDFDRAKTVSLFSDGVGMAHDKGVDRMTSSPLLPFDVHIAVSHAKRLNEWLRMLDSDVWFAEVSDHAGRPLIYCQNNSGCHQMWLPARRDGMIRQKIESTCRHPIGMHVQVERRPLREAIRWLSTLAEGHRLTLHFGGANGTSGIRLTTPDKRADGPRTSWGEARQEAKHFHQTISTGEELRVETGVLDLCAELNRFRDKCVTIAYRQDAKRLSIQTSEHGSIPPGHGEHTVSDGPEICPTESMLRARLVPTPTEPR